MKTIKTTITEVITREVEIKLPYYRKDGVCHWYMGINEKECIQVFLGNSSGAQIQIAHNGLALQEKHLECTEQEFNAMFASAVSKLKSLAYPETIEIMEEVLENSKPNDGEMKMIQALSQHGRYSSPKNNDNSTETLTTKN